MNATNLKSRTGMKARGSPPAIPGYPFYRWFLKRHIKKPCEAQGRLIVYFPTA